MGKLIFLVLATLKMIIPVIYITLVRIVLEKK